MKFVTPGQIQKPSYAMKILNSTSAMWILAAIPEKARNVTVFITTANSPSIKDKGGSPMLISEIERKHNNLLVKDTARA